MVLWFKASILLRRMCAFANFSEEMNPRIYCSIATWWMHPQYPGEIIPSRNNYCRSYMLRSHFQLDLKHCTLSVASGSTLAVCDHQKVVFRNCLPGSALFLRDEVVNFSQWITIHENATRGAIWFQNHVYYISPDCKVRAVTRSGRDVPERAFSLTMHDDAQDIHLLQCGNLFGVVYTKDQSGYCRCVSFSPGALIPTNEISFTTPFVKSAYYYLASTLLDSSPLLVCTPCDQVPATVIRSDGSSYTYIFEKRGATMFTIDPNNFSLWGYSHSSRKVYLWMTPFNEQAHVGSDIDATECMPLCTIARCLTACGTLKSAVCLLASCLEQQLIECRQPIFNADEILRALISISSKLACLLELQPNRWLAAATVSCLRCLLYCKSRVPDSDAVHKKDYTYRFLQRMARPSATKEHYRLLIQKCATDLCLYVNEFVPYEPLLALLQDSENNVESSLQRPFCTKKYTRLIAAEELQGCLLRASTYLSLFSFTQGFKNGL